jgi:hypothetical protein
MVHNTGPRSHNHVTWGAHQLHMRSTHQRSPIDLQDWRMELLLDQNTASEKDPENTTAHKNSSSKLSEYSTV